MYMRSNKPPATPIEFQVRGLPRLTSGNRNPQMPIELLTTNQDQIKSTNQINEINRYNQPNKSTSSYPDSPPMLGWAKRQICDIDQMTHNYLNEETETINP